MDRIIILKKRKIVRGRFRINTVAKIYHGRYLSTDDFKSETVWAISATEHLEQQRRVGKHLVQQWDNLGNRPGDDSGIYPGKKSSRWKPKSTREKNPDEEHHRGTTHVQPAR